jgi:hypothetical protein
VRRLAYMILAITRGSKPRQMGRTMDSSYDADSYDSLYDPLCLQGLAMSTGANEGNGLEYSKRAVRA